MIDIGKNGFKLETTESGIKIYVKNKEGVYIKIASFIKSTDCGNIIANIFKEESNIPIITDTLVRGNDKAIYEKSCNCENTNSSKRMIATYTHTQFERWAIDKFGNKLTLEEVEDYFDEEPIVYCEECGKTCNDIKES